jgi:hypothetical protein
MSNEQWVTTDSTHCSALIAIMKKTIIILFIIRDGEIVADEKIK